MFEFNDKVYYKLIKLIKIINLEEAKTLDAQSIILSSLGFINDISGSLFDSYSVNFGSHEFQNQNLLKKFISNNREIVDLTCTKGNKQFGYSNFLLNLTNQIPEFGTLQLTFLFDAHELDKHKTQNYIKEINHNLLIDYAYIRNLPKGNHLLSESRIKRTLFGGYSVQTQKAELTWNSHIYGINRGYLKDIYEINFLNKSQMQNPFIASFFDESLGCFEKFSSNLYLWTLTAEQVIYARDIMKNSPYLVGSDKGYKNFLKSEEAAEIRKKTFINLDIDELG